MNRLREVEWVSPDEATLRAWEEMRIEILHEIEDGGSVPDEQVDEAGDLAAVVNPWSVARPAAMGMSHIHVN